MQSLSMVRAIGAAMTLAPVGGDDLPTVNEVKSYWDMMSNIHKVRATVKIMEPIQSDLYVLRCMLAAELSRAEPRLPVVIVVLNAHEKLHRDIRIRPLLDELPALAVALDKAEPQAPGPAPIAGADLQAALTSAMFAPRICQVEGTPCRHKCAPDECQERGKKRLVGMLPRATSGFAQTVNVSHVPCEHDYKETGSYSTYRVYTCAHCLDSYSEDKL